MTAQIVDLTPNRTFTYTLVLKVDSTNNRARQDFYKGVGDISNAKPLQTVIGDYKYSLIIDLYENEETKELECNITRFDESLNTI